VVLVTEKKDPSIRPRDPTVRELWNLGNQGNSQVTAYFITTRESIGQWRTEVTGLAEGYQINKVADIIFSSKEVSSRPVGPRSCIFEVVCLP
jgi:hypothetical protein